MNQADFVPMVRVSEQASAQDSRAYRRGVAAFAALGYVWVLNGRAEPVLVLRGAPGSSTTNLAFGGEGRRQLYVTDSTHGRILRAALDAPGLALHRPR